MCNTHVENERMKEWQEQKGRDGETRKEVGERGETQSFLQGAGGGMRKASATGQPGRLQSPGNHMCHKDRDVLGMTLASQFFEYWIDFLVLPSKDMHWVFQ